MKALLFFLFMSPLACFGQSYKLDINHSLYVDHYGQVHLGLIRIIKNSRAIDFIANGSWEAVRVPSCQIKILVKLGSIFKPQTIAGRVYLTKAVFDNSDYSTYLILKKERKYHLGLPQEKLTKQQTHSRSSLKNARYYITSEDTVFWVTHKNFRSALVLLSSEDLSIRDFRKFNYSDFLFDCRLIWRR